MNKRSFCYICGGKVEEAGENVWHCPACQQNFYENPKPCVELALFNTKGELLLAKRAFEPWKGKWDLPGGFVEPGETLETALARELDEELGLKPEDVSAPQLAKEWTEYYPYGKETYPTIVFTYWAVLVGDKSIEPKDDVEAVEFRAVNQINRDQISIPKAYDAMVAAEKLRAN